MKNNKTVAIIGGGVSGLAVVGLLAQAGLRVLLFEANGKVGGSCGTTNLEEYIFNDDAFYLAMPDVLDYVFERMGINRSSQLPLRKITKPQTTKLPVGTIVIFMYFFLVAMIVMRSFEMFAILLGTWIPFSLIFLATYLTGNYLSKRKKNLAQSLQWRTTIIRLTAQ